MQDREFGRTGIYLSPVTFGSMRLDPQRISLDKAVELMIRLNERGVTTFHSSHEYDTHPFFCQVMQAFRRVKPAAEIVHIAKIADPHFDQTTFTGDRLSTLVENQLQALGAERIDIVQWLVRHQPNDDEHRLSILVECQHELNATWERLQKEGKVGALASFPYSVSFAKEVLKLPICKGLVTYLNILELEMVPFLNDMEKAGQGYVAIRPFHAGLITTESVSKSFCSTPENQKQELEPMLKELGVAKDAVTGFAIQFPLLHPVVSSVMISVTTLEHTEEVMNAAANASVDRTTFERITNRLTFLTKR